MDKNEKDHKELAVLDLQLLGLIGLPFVVIGLDIVSPAQQWVGWMWVALGMGTFLYCIYRAAKLKSKP